MTEKGGAFGGVATYEKADAASINALARGEATPYQQVRALKFIVEVLCATYDQSYIPGNPLDTAFREGRRFVGLQVVKHTKLSLENVRDGRSSPSST